MSFHPTAKGFDNGGSIPKLNTCGGADLSPELAWSGEQPGTEEFALIVDDPDAPGGTWNHWLRWDIPAHVRSLTAGFTPGTVGASGKNDFWKAGLRWAMPA
jgi:phosphatidylethanolamine-binding protein (PEBP) family uncharacterized protein